MAKIYLAGPMGGYENLNHDAFNEYAEALRDGGWEVFNPAEHDISLFGSTENSVKEFEKDPDKFRRTVMGVDTAWLCKEAEAIAMMPGWEKSLGANTEWSLAKFLQLEIIYL